MNEQDLRGLVAEVENGRLSRRSFVRRMIALGLTAPMAGMMLSQGGVARAADVRDGYKPTKAGGGGPLKLLFWQAPTLLNPHFAIGTKDQEACRIFYEPMAAWDDDGDLVAVLAAEVPSVANGAVAADGKSVVWKLKPGIKWQDGQPLTADDLVFTWQFAKDPASACTTIGSYQDVTVDKVDDLTIKMTFSKPTPFWAMPSWAPTAWSSPGTSSPTTSARSRATRPPTSIRSAPAPIRSSSSGPATCCAASATPPTTCRTGRISTRSSSRAAATPSRRPRAVLQTGEYDYAYNLQVEDEILKRLEEGGKGRITTVFGNYLEFVLLNATDPTVEVDGEKSSLTTKHFAFSDPAVCRAMDALLDRKSVAGFIYGRTGKASGITINGPAQFVSKTVTPGFDVAKANALLDEAGWAKGSDGIRAKDGKRLHFLFQTSINAPRQKTQAIIKQAAAKAGIEIELKATPASVFFSSDVANPDTYPHFYADMEMYSFNATSPDPGVWMLQYYGPQAAQKSNKWQGRNIARWQNAEFDKLNDGAAVELDPVKRAAMFIRMNDLVVSGNILPLVYRGSVAGLGAAMHAPRSGWDNDMWALPDWWKEA